MPSITVKMKDGTKKEFPHKGRSGGSYTKRLFYQGVFAVIEDEYGEKISIPAADIQEIIETPERW
jgi:hypothetical protein